MEVAELEVVLRAKNSEFKKSLEETKRDMKRLADESSASSKVIRDHLKGVADEAKKRELNKELERARKESKRLADQVAADAKRIRDAFHSFASGARSAGLALTASVTTPLLALGKASISAAVSMSNLERGMNTVMGSSSLARIEMEKLRKVAEMPGLGFEEALQGSINLQAAGVTADTARKAIAGFGNALATVGKGRAELEGVVTALSQIQSKGVVSAEEINQIAERVPQIRKLMIDAFGTANTEILQKAKLTSKEYIDSIVIALERLPQAAKGPAEELELAYEEWRATLVDLGREVLPELTSFLKETAVPVMRDLRDWWKELGKEGRETALKVGLLTVALGPGVGLAGMMLGAVSNGAKLVKTLGEIRAAAIAANSAEALGSIGTKGVAATGLIGRLGFIGTIIAGIAAMGKVGYDLSTASDQYDSEYQKMWDRRFAAEENSKLPIFQRKGMGEYKSDLWGPIGPRGSADARKDEIERVRDYQEALNEVGVGSGGKKGGVIINAPQRALENAARDKALKDAERSMKTQEKWERFSDNMWSGMYDTLGEVAEGALKALVKRDQEELARREELLAELEPLRRELMILQGATGKDKLSIEKFGKNYGDLTDPNNKAFIDQKSEYQSQIDSLIKDAEFRAAEFRGAWQSTWDEVIRLNKEAEKDAEFRAAVYKSQWTDIWNEVIRLGKEAQEEQDRIHDEMLARFEENAEAIKQQYEYVRGQVDKIVDSMASAVLDAFGSLDKGVSGFFNGLLNGVRNVLNQIAMEILKSEISKALGGLFGNVIGGLFGGGGGSGAGNALGGGIGGAVTNGFAAGGQILKAEPILVGDGGKPEVFVPESRGRILTANEAANAMGGGQIYINMTIQTPDANSFRRSEGQIAGELAARLQRERARNG